VNFSSRRSSRNLSPDHYGWGLIALHWLTLIVIAVSFVLGWVLEDWALSPLKLQLYAWHKWLGLLVFFLLPVRLLLRAFDPLTRYQDLAVWEGYLSLAVHGALYALMIAVPLSGWVYSSAAGFPVVWFGVLPLPDLVDKQEILAVQWKALHELAVNLFAALVFFHALAAVYHYRIRCDGVMARMAPWVRST